MTDLEAVGAALSGGTGRISAGPQAANTNAEIARAPKTRDKLCALMWPLSAARLTAASGLLIGIVLRERDTQYCADSVPNSDGALETSTESQGQSGGD
jgi:hypothetical protein